MPRADSFVAASLGTARQYLPTNHRLSHQEAQPGPEATAHSAASHRVDKGGGAGNIAVHHTSAGRTGARYGECS